MAKNNSVKRTPVKQTKGERFFAYAILSLFLLILAALTGKLVLWILGIEL